MFSEIQFIKSDIPFDKDKFDYAPMFRKVFSIDKKIEKAEIFVCGLGYAYYYINGKIITEDLFTAPVSNYCKTLWYNRYDVTELLNEGENVLAVMCGNGWFNEGIKTSWDFDQAPWRDNPKFILKLNINDETVLTSDSSWKYTLESPVIYNQLRSGEHFDSRLYDENWKSLDFDDSSWGFAKEDDTPPTGTFRECLCEPIRECEVYKTKEIIKVSEDKYVFDLGQNMSGYIRLRTNQPAGDVIKIRYAEQINEDYSRNLNEMEQHYKYSLFQTDEFICCGREFVWSPKFAYHGFRYIELEGIKNPTPETVEGIFVHQDIKRRSEFECSNEKLNRLFQAGIMATWSNLFYAPTDCPTREKLGWANDAQASTEQMFVNFEIEKLFEKWIVDIYDSQLESGALPGIIPTQGSWGYEWGNGPVSEGILFEIPYRMYLHTGDDTLLKKSMPYFKKYFEYLESQMSEDGSISYGLNDWAAPLEDDRLCAEFVNAVLRVKFLRIAQLAAEKCNESADEYKKEELNEIARIKRMYINSDGTCNIDKQSSVAMLIYYDIYDELEPLAKQLANTIERRNYHHNCGMVGLRRLYIALNKCGLQEYAYKIITSSGFPSYMDWLDGDATTLWEYWDLTYSKNHHMYSDFMSWMMKTIVGITTDYSEKGNEKIEINPYIFNDLEYAKGSINTKLGKVSVEWKKHDDRTDIKAVIPTGVKAYYKGELLNSGLNELTV